MYKILLFVLIAVVNVLALCKKCFDPGFIWGSATSSYQVEGAWNVSGKGESIWDRFTHTNPEKIEDLSNGDIAADSYHKYEEDVELLKNLGVSVYRLSISWPRVLPNGTTNNVNQEGVDYYLKLLKKLKENNIEAMVTLYHWDLPNSLQELGGWANPAIADYFNEYAIFCYANFGEYVKYWLTLNEPLMQCETGYGTGEFAPGLTQNGILTYTCMYLHLLAHAKAYKSYNETFKSTQKGEVGIVLVSMYPEPLDDTEDDRDAVERYLQFEMGLLAHPLVLGNWPQLVIDRVGNLSIKQGFNTSRLQQLTEDEIILIKGTFDYLGLNYYTSHYTTQINNITEIETTTVSYEVDRNAVKLYDPNWTQSESDWLYDVPTGFRKLLNWMAKNYGNQRIIITENGWSEHGNLNDTGRITYLQRHLCSLLKAKYMDGLDIFGYLYWSLLDSFEWAAGYTVGFGLVSVDFNSDNRTRSPKNSFYYYKNIISTNCLDYCVLNWK